MDVQDENVLDVDLLADDGSEEEGEAPPSSEFYTGPGSTPTSCASSPRGEEPASPHGTLSQPSFFHHQSYTRPFFTSGRRGPGRPRKEGPKLVREGKIVRRAHCEKLVLKKCEICRFDCEIKQNLKV